MSLDAFFSHVAPFLVRGAGNLDDLEGAVGASSSGRERLALYRKLVHAQHVVALELAFPALARALGEEFRPLIDAYLAAGAVCRTRHPSGLGAELPEFATRTIRDRPWVGELADFERTRFEVATASAPTPVARFYWHDVPLFVERAADGPPTAIATAVILHRDRDDDRVRVMRATTAHLVALGIALGELTAEDAPPIEAGVLAEARSALIARGVLR